MNKRAAALLLSLAIALSLVGAAHAEETPDNPTPCEQTPGCTQPAGHEGDCVVTDPNAGVSDPAAQVNGTSYATLAEALAAAADGDTVTVLRDIELDEAVCIEKSLTLDLGGHTLTCAWGVIFLDTPGVAATIKNGTIDGENYAVDVERGTLNLQDCTVTGAWDTVLAGGDPETGTGTVNLGSCKVVGDWFAVFAEKGAAVNLTGCTVSATSDYAMYANKQASLRLTGCTVSTDERYAVCVEGGSVASLTDCTVTAGWRDAILGEDAAVSLVNCTVSAWSHAIEVEGSTLDATGCTVSCNRQHAVYSETSTVSLTDCALSAPHGFALWNDDDATMQLTGCTVEADDDVALYVGSGSVSLTSTTMRATGSNGWAVDVCTMGTEKTAAFLMDAQSVLEAPGVGLAVVGPNITADVYGSVSGTTDGALWYNDPEAGSVVNVYAGATFTSENGWGVRLDSPQAAIRVYGGTFPTAVPDEYLAEGCLLISNADGTVTVRAATEEAVGSGESGEPAGPAGPEVPAEAAGPEVPAVPETSANSETPVNPEAPAAPETPVNPETPANGGGDEVGRDATGGTAVPTIVQTGDATDGAAAAAFALLAACFGGAGAFLLRR
jgi:hypothetical protein